MIRVTVWYEYVQEAGEFNEEFLPKDMSVEEKARLKKRVADVAAKIKEVYPKGVMGTVAEHLESCEDMQVTSVRMNMPEYGLPDNLLNHTDVLIWWAHVAHDRIPDCLVEKIKDRVLKGMGFIPLHSAHPSKPMKALLGTSGSLKWREGDFLPSMEYKSNTSDCTGNIPKVLNLRKKKCMGNFFDIPKPDDVVFLSWYRGGEVFRSGCTWQRGYGKIFYFSAGT